MAAEFPGKKRERETGFEFGSARNTLKGRWFLAPPVRSPTPGPTVTKFVTGTIVFSHIHKSYQKEDRYPLSNIHRYDLDADVLISRESFRHPGTAASIRLVPMNPSWSAVMVFHTETASNRKRSPKRFRIRDSLYTELPEHRASVFIPVNTCYEPSLQST